MMSPHPTFAHYRDLTIRQLVESPAHWHAQELARSRRRRPRSKASRQS